MPKTNTSRLDLLVVERGLLPSRQAAQAAIIDGGVIVDGQKITKPGVAVKIDAKVELTTDWQGKKYVSRGGFKLEQALTDFRIQVADRICLDLGASTGGFTHCLLQHGASKVYAIDVGYGQLDWALRQDPRVIVRERVNARSLTAEDLYAHGDEKASLAVADLSFISVIKVLPACKHLLQPEGDVVALVKPQFEAGKDLVGKGGVIREASTHLLVLEKMIESSSRLGFITLGLTYSPIKGREGNIEFLIHLQASADESLLVDQPQIHSSHAKAIVEAAHSALD